MWRAATEKHQFKQLASYRAKKQMAAKRAPEQPFLPILNQMRSLDQIKINPRYKGITANEFQCGSNPSILGGK